MFNRSKQETIRSIQVQYQEKYNSNAHAIRCAIPANEVWRFFIERRNQCHGRGLKAKLSGLHGREGVADEYKDKSLKEYVEQLEELEINTQEDWDESKFGWMLAGRDWSLTREQWQVWTFNDLIKLDKGWLPFEINERGYLQALYQAFDKCFDLSVSFDISLIKSLHKLATTGVEGTNYANDEGEKGQFRSQIDIGFRLDPGASLSFDGLCEFFNAKSEDQYIELEFHHGKALSDGSLQINEQSLAKIREYIANKKTYSEIKLPFSAFIDEEKSGHLQYAIKNDEKYQRVITVLGESSGDYEALKFLFILAQNNSRDFGLAFISDQAKIERDELDAYFTKKIQKYINVYEAHIKKYRSPMNVLIGIAEVVRCIELLHPFKDANGRTVCMLLLNYLLMKNNFPPAILNDSNRFNLYSTSELVDELIKGMSNTLTMASDNSLFEFKESDLYQGLSNSAIIEDYMQNFAKINSQEKINRNDSPSFSLD